MIDYCAMMETQFFVLRDDDKNGLAIFEVPMTACLDNGREIILNSLTGIYLSGGQAHLDWMGTVSAHRIEIQFKWHPDVCQNRPMSDAMTHLAREHDEEVTLFPISRNDAESALLLGYLDYFRTTDVRKFSNNDAVKLEIEYVGKLEAEGAWPTLPRYETKEDYPDLKQKIVSMFEEHPPKKNIEQKTISFQPRKETV